MSRYVKPLKYDAGMNGFLMSAQIWSWVLTFIGVSGFYLAGRKIWWAWYINIANQVIWAAYAITTHQWGFLAGIPVYLAVFVPNAVRWTKERTDSPKEPITFEVVGSMFLGNSGLTVAGTITDPKLIESLNKGIPCDASVSFSYFRK